MPTYFLTVVTRTRLRTQLLALNQASVSSQTIAKEVEHLIVRDDIGLGVEKANTLYHGVVAQGEYVFPLDDDDALMNTRVVAELKNHIMLLSGHPPFVVVKARHPWGVIPEERYWGKGLPPYGAIGNSNVVVRKDVWETHKQNYAPVNQGDYLFAQSLFRDFPDAPWIDLVVASVPVVNHGRTFDDKFAIQYSVPKGTPTWSRY